MVLRILFISACTYFFTPGAKADLIVLPVPNRTQDSCADHLQTSHHPLAEVVPFKPRVSEPPARETRVSGPRELERQEHLYQCRLAFQAPEKLPEVIKNTTHNERAYTVYIHHLLWNHMQDWAKDASDVELKDAAQAALTRWQDTDFLTKLEASVDVNQLKPSGQFYNELTKNKIEPLDVLCQEIIAFRFDERVTPATLKKFSFRLGVLRTNVLRLKNALDLADDDLERVTKVLNAMESSILNSRYAQTLQDLTPPRLSMLGMTPRFAQDVQATLDRIQSLRAMADYIRRRGLGRAD